MTTGEALLSTHPPRKQKFALMLDDWVNNTRISVVLYRQDTGQGKPLYQGAACSYNGGEEVSGTIQKVTFYHTTQQPTVAID